MLPILQPALDDWGGLPSREPRAVAQQEGDCPAAPELSIEGTDRRRQRPKNQATQALPYRGTQKTQSDKNVVVVTAKTKGVGYLSQT